MADTAFSPLVDFRPKYDDSMSYTQPVPKVSPVIPKDIQPDTIEAKLKAEGSGTSTISMITAWLGAAKGDYRGLQAIEESKRRTALAKSMIPEMTKVNKLVQSGKWEEASDYVNEMASSYGTRADYLVPYFTQMQADIKKKQEGWKNLEFLYKAVKDKVPEDHPNYAIVQILEKAVADRDQPSETTLQGLMTRYAAPHIQNIEGTVYSTSPLTGKTARDIQPQTYKDKDFDTVTGIQTAAKAGLTTQMMADLFNGRAVTREDNTTITPDSKEAAIIKSYFISQQPKEARLKIMQNVKLEPTLYAQLISQGVSPENIALGEYGGKGMDEAITGQLGRQTEATIAANVGSLLSDPTYMARVGLVPISFDTTSPNFLREMQPAAYADVVKQGGNIGFIRREVLDKEVKPALREIESLDLIPNMLEGGNTPQSRGDVLKEGINRVVSRRIGYNVDSKVQLKEAAATILRNAIEEVENVGGHDKKEIAAIKAYAAGDFQTNEALLKAVEQVKMRLGQVIERAVGVQIPTGASKTDASQLRQAPTQSRSQSPASAISKVIPRGRAPQGQVTRQPYSGENISLPPGVDDAIVNAVRERAKTGVTGGAETIQIPKQGAPVVSTGKPTTAPTLGQPIPEAQLSAEDRIKAAMDRKKQQRMR